MKSILGFIAFSGVVVLSASNAQADNSSGRLNRLSEELALSDVQVSALEPIFAADRTKRYTCFTTSTWRDCLKTLKGETDTLIKAQLTTGQSELFDQIQKGPPPQGNQPNKPPPPPRQGDGNDGPKPKPKK